MKWKLAGAIRAEESFRDFKLHVVVNQLGLPLKATVTPENLFDSLLLPDLLKDLEADYVLVDEGYDSKRKSGVDCCFGSNYSTDLTNNLADAS